MPDDVQTYFNPRKGTLEVRFGNQSDIIDERSKLTNKFLEGVYESFVDVEKTEKVKTKDINSIYNILTGSGRRLAGVEKDYSGAVKKLELYPQTITESNIAYLRRTLLQALEKERMHNFSLRDKWENISYFFVTADLCIDAAAIAMGVYKWVVTDKWEQGLEAFGFMAVIGAGLLGASYAFKRVKEIPYKRKSRYSARLSAIPLMLHAKAAKDKASREYLIAPDERAAPDASAEEAKQEQSV